MNIAPVEEHPLKSLLESLRKSDGCYLTEQIPEGFAIVRRDVEYAEAFNALARATLERSGIDYVALPRTDGPTGYDRVFIIPLN